MTKRYQIIQERYAGKWDNEPVQDEYPVLFDSIERARERAKSGTETMFEHKGDALFIVELEPRRGGMTYTGRQFPL